MGFLIGTCYGLWIRAPFKGAYAFVEKGPFEGTYHGKSMSRRLMKEPLGC